MTTTTRQMTIKFFCAGIGGREIHNSRAEVGLERVSRSTCARHRRPELFWNAGQVLEAISLPPEHRRLRQWPRRRVRVQG